MISHIMEIFALTRYDAHVILNSTKVHIKQRLQSVSANSISPPETPESAQAHALSYGMLVRVFIGVYFRINKELGNDSVKATLSPFEQRNNEKAL